LGLADAEFPTSLLVTKVGERPRTLGTESIFGLLKELVEDMGKMQHLVSVLESPTLAAAQEQQLAIGIAQDIVTRLHPLFRLYGAWLTSKDTPGDILEERLAALKGSVATGSPLGTDGGNWFNSQMSGLNVGVTAPTWLEGEDTQGMSRQIRILEDLLKDMQDEMTSCSVQIGTMMFVSRTQTKAWMDLHRCPPRTCIFFLDALVMLALMHSGSESAKSAAEFALVMTKVGYKTTDEALVVTSFGLELPKVFVPYLSPAPSGMLVCFQLFPPFRNGMAVTAVTATWV
jgi:hypothetical protein